MCVKMTCSQPCGSTRRGLPVAWHFLGQFDRPGGVCAWEWWVALPARGVQDFLSDYGGPTATHLPLAFTYEYCWIWKRVDYTCTVYRYQEPGERERGSARIKPTIW